MVRLRFFSGRELCRLLEKQGFVEVRRRGSHVVMQRLEGASTRTVLVPDHSEIRIGTLQSIVRQSGLARKLFETE